MRTKTLFLAAAFVAAGLASSMAQSNVYSLNIVGYYNVPISTVQTLCANSLRVGTPTDRLDQVIPATPANDGDAVAIWNGVKFVPAFIDGGVWVDVNTDPIPLANLPVLGSGVGFFYTKGNVNTTNVTFVGEVRTGTNTVSISLQNNALGSPLPYAGAIASGPIAVPVADGDQIQKWNGIKFVTTIRDGADWTDVNAGIVAEPSLTVGEGFFYTKLGGASIPWTQVLNP